MIDLAKTDINRADSALYSREESSSRFSESVAVGDLHYSNAAYNLDEFYHANSYLADHEEQIYENLASILRKTRQLSEATRGHIDCDQVMSSLWWL